MQEEFEAGRGVGDLGGGEPGKRQSGGTKTAEGETFRRGDNAGESAEGDGFAGAVAGAGTAFDAEVGLDFGLAIHNLDRLDGAIGNARFASHAFIFVNNSCHNLSSLVSRSGHHGSVRGKRYAGRWGNATGKSSGRQAPSQGKREGNANFPRRPGGAKSEEGRLGRRRDLEACRDGGKAGMCKMNEKSRISCNLKREGNGAGGVIPWRGTLRREEKRTAELAGGGKRAFA